VTRADETLTRLDVENAVARAFLAVVSAQQTVVAADDDVRRRDVLVRTAHTLADNQLRPCAEASRADAERAAAQTRALFPSRSSLCTAIGSMSVSTSTMAMATDSARPISPRSRTA
jgi:hypothetical protein